MAIKKTFAGVTLHLPGGTPLPKFFGVSFNYTNQKNVIICKITDQELGNALGNQFNGQTFRAWQRVTEPNGVVKDRIRLFFL